MSIASRVTELRGSKIGVFLFIFKPLLQVFRTTVLHCDKIQSIVTVYILVIGIDCYAYFCFSVFYCVHVCVCVCVCDFVCKNGFRIVYV